MKLSEAIAALEQMAQIIQGGNNMHAYGGDVKKGTRCKRT